MEEAGLFPGGGGDDDGVAATSGPSGGEPQAPPRLRRPDRQQVLLRPCAPEGLLPERHQARTLWAVVERLDPSGFHAPLRARGGRPGRAATDPRLLVALWLWAATQGVGGARAVARPALRRARRLPGWLRGGVGVNHHTPSDFRTGHGPALDELFTLVLAKLIGRKLVSVRRISRDGMRVRASAGAGS